MGKKRKAGAACSENQPRVEGAAHVKYQFNSQTFERLLATVHGFKEEEEVFRNKDISIKVTTKGYLDAPIKFELSEMKKELKGQVTMHLYPGTTSLMVQGNSGRILNKTPFLCFADVFLEPLIAGEEDLALGKRMRRDEEEVKRTEQEFKGKQEEKKQVKEQELRELEVKAMEQALREQELKEQELRLKEQKLKKEKLKEEKLKEEKLKEEKLREQKLKEQEQKLKERELKEMELKQHDYVKNLFVKNAELKRMLSEERALTSQLREENAELRRNISSRENKPVDPSVLRQKNKFTEQHVNGHHDASKPRNTVVTSKLEGQAAIPLRISGSTKSKKGRGAGEVIYTTREAVQYRGSGRRDRGTGGEGSLVFTGVKEGEAGVAGVHLNGVARAMDDGHLQFGGEIYSQCLSQTQRFL